MLVKMIGVVILFKKVFKCIILGCFYVVASSFKIVATVIELSVRVVFVVFN